MEYALTLESIDQKIHITDASENLKQLAYEYSNPPKLPIDIENGYLRLYNLTHRLREIYTYLYVNKTRIIKVDSIQLPHADDTFIDYAVIGIHTESNVYELNIYILNNNSKYLISKIINIEKILDEVKEEFSKQQQRTDVLYDDIYNGNNSHTLKLQLHEAEIKSMQCTLEKLDSFDEKIIDLTTSTHRLNFLVEELIKKTDEITLGKLFKNLTWRQLSILAVILLIISTSGSKVALYLKDEIQPLVIELIKP